MNVNELTPESEGIYLITTQGSTHLWDLDRLVAVRNPGRVGATMDELLRGFDDGYNGSEIPILSVETWPVVGKRFLITVQPPQNWHLSSAIKSIEKVE